MKAGIYLTQEKQLVEITEAGEVYRLEPTYQRTKKLNPFPQLSEVVTEEYIDRRGAGINIDPLILKSLFAF